VIPASARRALAAVMSLALLVVYLPLAVVLVNSFNSSRTFSWPPSSLTTHWWSQAWQSTGARSALRTSVEAGLGATAVALLLGTMAAFAVSRYSWFGRETVSFLLLLPIALPGIVTGIALNNALRLAGAPFGLVTIIVGHSTFCVVLVFNNALARLRRLGGTLEEASMDLGAGVGQTFRYVTFPLLRSSLLAGGLLAFALSFDEIIVTTFTSAPGVQTLPLWIFGNLFRPNQAPVVNVVAAALIVASVLPVWVAQRLSGDPVGARH
jgi:putative spermidine/putrescine transport system permease protein